MDADFIIIGAGSAGCVLADRLSRNGRHRVLVLEAGGSDRHFWISMPLGYGKTFYDPQVNWMYETEPDPGLGGRRDYWPRGKVLGGSSSINAMVWIRGAAGDYDDWAAEGNPGWAWKDVLPAFKAIEDFEGGGDEYRGAGGPIHISDVSRELHPLCRNYLDAAKQAGLPFNPDFNGAAQEGVGLYQINTRKGRRHSAAAAFLRPAMKRPNVEVRTGVHVTRLVFDGRRVTGVEYMDKGQPRVLKAGREVILSGGSINSPQLLQLSGIGDGAQLRGLGIDVVHDNPNVGRHLQDHIGLNYTYRSRRKTLNNVLRPALGKLSVGLDYLLRGKGPLSLSLNQGGGFFRTRPDLKGPNMQLYMQAITTLKPKEGERPLLEPDPFPGFSLGLSNCRPRARGHLHIASADPGAAPKIVANGYGEEEDLAEMLEGVKFLRRLAAQPAFAEVIEEELLPGASIQSDADLVSDIRERSGTVYHPIGTCRMGPDAATSVVDSRLRAHGLEGLRVVDASVFPNNITGNTNAACMMTGYKGAELILADHNG